MINIKNSKTLQLIGFGILSHDVLLHKNDFHEFRNKLNEFALQLAKDKLGSNSSNCTLISIENYWPDALNGLSSKIGTDDFGYSARIATNYKSIYDIYLSGAYVFVPDEKYFEVNYALHNRSHVPNKDWHRVNWHRYVEYHFNIDYKNQINKLSRLK